MTLSAIKISIGEFCFRSPRSQDYINERSTKPLSQGAKSIHQLVLQILYIVELAANTLNGFLDDLIRR